MIASQRNYSFGKFVTFEANSAFWNPWFSIYNVISNACQPRASKLLKTNYVLPNSIILGSQLFHLQKVEMLSEELLRWQ